MCRAGESSQQAPNEEPRAADGSRNDTTIMIVMHAIGLWLALLAAPFWETKTPPEWSEDQMRILLTDSPWSQALTKGGAFAFLATAQPMQDLEREVWKAKAQIGRAHV